MFIMIKLSLKKYVTWQNRFLLRKNLFIRILSFLIAVLMGHLPIWNKVLFSSYVFFSSYFLLYTKSTCFFTFPYHRRTYKTDMFQVFLYPALLNYQYFYFVHFGHCSEDFMNKKRGYKVIKKGNLGGACRNVFVRRRWVSSNSIKHKSDPDNFRSYIVRFSKF